MKNIVKKVRGYVGGVGVKIKSIEDAAGGGEARQLSDLRIGT